MRPSSATASRSPRSSRRTSASSSRAQTPPPAGCGGVALLDGFAEVKRMYVRATARGRGIAETILARIEAAARDAGYATLRLETGDRQVAAMKFYERAGFRRCAAFGAYAAMPAHAISTSVFFEKSL
ncbi:MAG: GNAT family N-acetyltransferase [Deltaproteobacteria bacterium]|nr:GNAT family N-acetyltransferase [Deltaproteobacteria bacterium]